MEPTFTTGQVVVFRDRIKQQFLPAIVKAVKIRGERIEYLLDVQSGSGFELHAAEATASQEGILTFKEFSELLKNSQ
ncbi:MAG TPA: hypothetical protein VGE26_01795 [Sphingobacteriaceae bacterium]